MNSSRSELQLEESVRNEVREYLEEEQSIFDGRYRLIRPLAKVTSGGCVWAAEHVRTRRTCALKLFSRESNERVRKRVVREMEALAQAQGTGVVEFRDGGECDGRPYLVFELLEGRTLAGLLAAKARLSVDQTVKLGVDIATPLAHCHARGIIHRDIKPANIFVTSNNSVQLIDFGIAKLAERAEEVEKLTQENTLLGTPEYMAPEALILSPDVDHRADQYALAVTLYECLTGAVPFPGTFGEVLAKVSMGKMRPLQEVCSDVPDALAEVVRRALSRDSASRYPNIEAMRDALRASLPAAGHDNVFELRAGQPKLERNPATTADSPIARLKPSLSRRRHPRAPYVTLALVTIGGASVDGRIEEISESGFQFVAERPLPDGENFAVRFARPVTGRISEATAAIRWRRGARGMCAAGFEFTNLPSDAVAEIRTYVSIMCAD